MTDKQIIIDSSKCKYYWNGHCSAWDNTLIGACDDFEDCYCKMYLRKEQECKDLREDIKDIANLLDLDTGEEYNFGNIELEIKQLKAKEQECEELTSKCIQLEEEFEQLEAYKMEAEEGKEINAELKAENEELKKKIKSYQCNEKNANRCTCAFKCLENAFCNDAENKIDEIQTKIKVLKIENEILSNKLEQEENWHKTSDEISKANSEYTIKLKQTLAEIKEIAEPYQKEIKKICGNCNNYDDCHACCKFDLNCYKYKKGDTTACEKFIVSWKYDKNELANKILQKINEVEDE